jgi:hypothetical protein
MINHRDRLLLIPQIDADHSPVTRQKPPQPLPPRIPPPVTPRHAATLTHKTSSSCDRDTKPGLSHQGGRPRINHTPAGQTPLARPSYYYGGDVRVMQLRAIAGRDWDRLLSAAPR